MSANASVVGRAAELEVLGRAVRSADAGRWRAIGVLGEPGIGKSTLLSELGGLASARGHLVLAGRVAELERDIPFGLWVDALDEHIARDGAALLSGVAGEQLGELAVALPAVRRVTGVAPGVVVERHRVARALRELLGRLAGARPVTVLLDDVQWADPASADVIALLLHRPPRGAVLLGLAGRAGRVPKVESALERAVRDGGVELLELGPLPREAADALVPASLGRVARARVHRESGGNPLYLEALVRAELMTLPAAVHEGAPGVPRAVTVALAGEISVLPQHAQVLAQGAAVAGDPFDPSVAAVAAGIGEEAALRALDDLLAADVVRATERPRRFRFRHPLVRRAVYEMVGGGWKLAAHARCAQGLAARGAPAAERAHHVERAAQAGDLAAVELLAAAADETLPVAPATAAGWYEAALRLLPGAGEHEQRRRALLRGQGLALVSAGRPAEASDALGRLLAIVPREAAAERAGLVVTLAELEATWLQRPDEARRLLEAERAALGTGAPGPAAGLTLALARERVERGDHAAAETLADQARAAARATGDRALEADAAAQAADAAHSRLSGEAADALAAVDRRMTEAGALVDALSDEEVSARPRMLLALGIARLSDGSLVPTLAAAERGIALSRRMRHGLLTTAFMSLRGYVNYDLGRLDAAEEDEEEVLESALISGNVQVAYWASILLSRVALARGRVDAALKHGQDAWDRLGAIERSQAGFTVANARLAAGDPHGALAALDAFGWVTPELRRVNRLKSLEVAVRALLAVGRVEEAAAWARRAPAEAGGRRTGLYGAIIALAEAAVLLVQDAAPEAARRALAGADAADTGHAPLWAGRCRTLAGEALATSGCIGDARDVLRRAAADLDQRGAWGERDAALSVLRRLGERPRPSRAAGPLDERVGALTPREREVAGLVADGRTNAQIALRLQVKEGTVEKHVSSALAKLGMSSRAGIVALLASDRAPAGGERG
jgi:DNA-binding CsgD family transcriptional regulator